MTSTARAREYRSRLDDGAAQLYCRTGSRPWLLELAAPLDDDPADPPWTRGSSACRCRTA